MITLQEFLRCVEENVKRIKRYQLGGDGSGGGCDCIGLIIGAVRLAGVKWPWTHGSNYAARYRVRGLHRVTKASQLRLGDLVFKAREPGEAGYALPEKYASSGDLRDYYHVGGVTSVNPLIITHCTGVAGGIKRDTTLGQWRWAGELNLVDYNEGGDGKVEALYKAVVTASSGKTVNLRKSASANAKVIEAVPIGTVVDVTEETNDTWAKVDDGGVAGYMMRKFLLRSDESSLSRADAEEIKRLISEALTILNQALKA
ncbi:MAG: SH3 domain-containing protein [Clostridia bacterium]|nr:SH3 domain-containing protein [Clostridia bacterium]